MENNEPTGWMKGRNEKWLAKMKEKGKREKIKTTQKSDLWTKWIWNSSKYLNNIGERLEKRYDDTNIIRKDLKMTDRQNRIKKDRGMKESERESRRRKRRKKEEKERKKGNIIKGTAQCSIVDSLHRKSHFHFLNYISLHKW